jgi:hypothetical protein
VAGCQDAGAGSDQGGDVSFHNDPCSVCGFDYGPFVMMTCIECKITYCSGCAGAGHDCEVEDDDSE